MKGAGDQIADLERQVKKYRKNYSKSKEYSKELEQNILNMDQKIKDIKRQQKEQAIAT